MAEGEESFCTDGGFGGLLFLFRRMAAEAEGEAEADLLGGRFACFRLEALGEVAGLLEHEGIVAEGECLQGRCGDEALGGEVGRVGTVQGGEELVRSDRLVCCLLWFSSTWTIELCIEFVACECQ